MSRTVTAFFDNRGEAEQARQELTTAGIGAENVRIVDQGSAGATGSSSGHTPGEEGFWASLKDLFMPDEDRHAYGEGIRRGGFLLSAQVDERQADEACRILDRDGTVDFDRRQDEWRSSGWSGYQGSLDATSGASMGATTGAYARDAVGESTGGGATRATGSTVQEEHIPIVEEQLVVGKREVERGGARVRSYIREIPVHEQVSLREEHVSVERRPVDGRVETADLRGGDAFRERSIEMTETSEEAVVAKEARVTEELVVRKTAEERVEQIDDTVRRTEVEVDEGLRAKGDRTAFTGLESERNRDDLTRTDRSRVD